MLNQNQFPAIPSTTPPIPINHTNGVLKQPKTVRWQTNSIPAWQLAENGVVNGGDHKENNSSTINGDINGHHQKVERNDEKVDEEEFQ